MSSFEVEEEFDLAKLGFVDSEAGSVRGKAKEGSEMMDMAPSGIDQNSVEQKLYSLKPESVNDHTDHITISDEGPMLEEQNGGDGEKVGSVEGLADSPRSDIQGSQNSDEHIPREVLSKAEDGQTSLSDDTVTITGRAKLLLEAIVFDSERLAPVSREIKMPLELDHNANGQGSSIGKPQEHSLSMGSDGPYFTEALEVDQGIAGVEAMESGHTGSPPKNGVKAKLIKIRRPGKPARWSLKIKKTQQQQENSSDTDTDAAYETDTTTPCTRPDPIPETFFLRQLHETSSESTLKIEAFAKEHNNTGYLLPLSLRDFFPGITDKKEAIKVINAVRGNLGFPLLKGKMDPVKLTRSLASMRETLYTEIMAALVLSSAPEPLPPKEAGGEEERNDLSLTPTSLDILGRTLPKAFQHDKSSIKKFLEGDKACGEEGDVVWIGGVGRMKRKLKEGEKGIGFRGDDSFDGDVHVFVDYSNILYGLLHHLYTSTQPLPPRHQRVLSLPCLSLLLRRGRVTQSGTLHLIASSPLQQDLNPLVRLGWEVSIMKRVEIHEEEVLDHTALNLTPKPISHLSAPTISSSSPKLSSPMVINGENKQSDKLDMVKTLSSSSAHSAHSVIGKSGNGAFRRYKEQGVDEVLTLKILQTLNRLGGEGRTIVLATGDARGGQFNKEGFLGAVKVAMLRGWNVELWAWSEGLSRAWKETAKKEGWGGKFRIHLLDDWAHQLVEVNQDLD